jgi:hypothetical protein
MRQLENNLSDIFDIEATEKKAIVVAEPEVTDATVENDFLAARKNISSLLAKGNTAIDQLLLVAKETEHPRAYEVAANLIKTLGDLNKDLLDLQKKKKDLSGTNSTNTGNTTNIDKAVFVGSTNELVKLIRSNK